MEGLLFHGKQYTHLNCLSYIEDRGHSSPDKKEINKLNNTRV